MRPLSLTALKDDLDRSLEESLISSHEWQMLSARSPEIFSRIRAFVFSSGKRLRPLLFTLLYRGYAAQPAAGQIRVALALELLHSFVLIHDDIVDRSPTRRVQPTLHCQFNHDLHLNTPGRIKGEDLALVTGDVLYALALHLYQTAELPSELREQGMAYLTEAALLTGQGELLELMTTLSPPGHVTEQELYEIYDLKTAHYTFCCPMLLGAVLGRAPEADHQILRELGLLLGRAYQVSDDLVELDHNEPSPSDFAEKRYTLLVHWALEKLPENERQEILQFLDDPNPSTESIRSVQQLLAGSPAVPHARQKIDAWLNEARGLTKSLALTEPARQGLLEIISHIGAAVPANA